jgi:hypothetical protein
MNIKTKEMKNNIQEYKEALVQDKSAFIKIYENALKTKITEVEIIDNNELFDKLLDELPAFELVMNNFTELRIKTELKEFITLVQTKKGGILKFHNTITFFLEDGSHIRFSSYKSSSIEISRVWVHPYSHRNGIGSLLMDLMFDFINFAECKPNMYFLECTGAIGVGANAQSVGIDVQTKFFRKFGFRVDNKKQYPDYVTMVMKPVS